MECDSIVELYVSLFKNGNKRLLKQLKSLPKINLWTDKEQDDVLSDVSSLQSSPGSSISQEDGGSVSVMSSSDDSIESLKDLEDESTRHIPYNTNEKFIIGSDINLGEQLANIKTLLGNLAIVTRVLRYGSYGTGMDLIQRSLTIIKEINKSTCIISSINYIITTHHKLDNHHLVQVFTNVYSEMVAFHTYVCKTLNTISDVMTISLSITSFPYIIDTILECIINILYHLDNLNAQNELSKAFDKIVKSTLLFSCCYSDHYSDSIRQSCIHVLYDLSLLLLPLNCINNNDKLLEELLQEYFKNNFKPSSILLYKLRGAMDMTSIKKLQEGYISTVEMFMRTGVTKRKYPTFVVTPDDCMSVLSTNDDSVWNKCTYWLLSRLEDIDVTVRVYTLKIISHILCTISFIEKDRQHILSYVYNCLSDDDTLTDSLSVLTKISQLYPMKDGAVKRISTLTLKGSRSTRLKVIIAFGNCKFTSKGLSTLLYLLQSLAEPSIKDQHNGTLISVKNQYVTSSIEDQDTELLFARHEWPSIISTLEKLSKTHETGDITLLKPPLGYIKMNRLNLIPATTWIPMIWYGLRNNDDEAWKLSALLWSGEAKIRFPRLKFSVDGKLIDEYLENLDTFIQTQPLSEEFIKNRRIWKSLHRLLVPSSINHLQRASVQYRILNGDTITPDDKRREEGIKESKRDDKKEGKPARGTHSTSKQHQEDKTSNICTCIDCEMDRMIIERQDSPNFEKLINDLDLKCKIHLDESQDEKEIIECNLGANIGSIRHKYIAELSRCYSIVPEFELDDIGDVEEILIDDINCLTFPASLGSQITIKLKSKALFNVVIYLKLPKADGSTSHSFQPMWKEAKDGEGNVIYTSIIDANIYFPHATTLPIPLKIISCLGNENIKVCVYDDNYIRIQTIGQIWIHPKHIVG